MSTPEHRQAPSRESAPSRAHAEALQSAATEGLYRALLNAALDPTIAIDAQGIVVTASDSVEHVFGWSPRDLVGRNIKVLLPEPHRSLHDDYLANYRRTGVTHILGLTREFDVVHKNGSLINCELSVARAPMQDGAMPLFLGSFRDITARKHAERALAESERRFRAIFDRSYGYIGLLQLDGTLIEANQAALDAIGATREDVVGRKFWETRWWGVSEEAGERLKSAIHEAAGGEFVRFETVQRGRGDELLVVDFSISPVRNEKGAVVLLIPEGRNITELKRAQRAETAMLRALATLGESAAMLAHEIKNPITAVNLALRAVAHALGEDQQAVLADLVGRMQHLEGLMRRTLTFTKPLELRLSMVQPRVLVDHVVKQLGPEIGRRHTEVRCEIDESNFLLECDRQLLEEVLTNLVTNALEALGTGGHVVISARRQADGKGEIAVDDDGPGISPAINATLFNPFTTSKFQGTGLGLAFCRKVVEEHGGSIKARISPLGGARFEIQLPALR
ncbi:MAG TPA: PAS domain S-box protein [Planctomycetota bacterium]|nr:PAS domain S-box protein [Planctomycetota bacterium]